MPRWEEGPYTRFKNRSITLCLFTKFCGQVRRIPELLELCGNLSFYCENSVKLIVRSKMELQVKTLILVVTGNDFGPTGI